MDHTEFTKYAVEMMHNEGSEDGSSPWNEIGSGSIAESLSDLGIELPTSDCITHAIRVLSYAFKKSDNHIAAKKVRRLGAYGTKLAEYLVKSHGWKGIYVTRDFHHPHDGNIDYVGRNNITKRSCKYWGIPIRYMAVNYNPTSRPASYHCKEQFNACKKLYDNSDFVKGAQKKYRDIETPLNTNVLKILSKVEFGFGVSKGGRHTWLFSKGIIYDASSGRLFDLYREHDLKSYGYVTNAIVVPPSEHSKLIGLDKCIK